MALQDSDKLFKAMNDRSDADDYINGLLKDPAMQVDMEQAAQPVTWQQAAEGIEPVGQREPNGELER